MNDIKTDSDNSGILIQNNINPFDILSGTYFILINEIKQQSLWPSFKDIPKGWIIKYGPATREECLSQARYDKSKLSN